jgi:hypothetical protein
MLVWRKSYGTLRDSPSPHTLFKVLRSTARTWGDQVWFSVPVDIEPESDARQAVEAGEVVLLD